MKNFFSLCLLFLGFYAEAQTEEPASVIFAPAQLGAASASDPIVCKIFDRELLNEDGTANASAPSALKSVRRSVSATLFVNPYVERPSLTPFNITLQCAVKYKTSASGSLSTKIYPLNIQYSPSDNSYKAKDYFKIPDAIWAEVSVSKQNSSPASFAAGDSTFRLYLYYQAEKYITPTPAQLAAAPAIVEFKSSDNGGYLKFVWEKLDWAHHYEAEYLFVDNYGTGTTRKPASAIPYNFRFNSTRISTEKNEIEIPQVFESGYIVARVRAVGMQGSNFDEPAYGFWDLPNAGPSLPPDGKHVFEVIKPHEGDKMNWQYTAAFAGDDLRKDAVQYMDGTLRARQSVSTAHADQNLLVSETIYDHQGRPVIQMLPAPVKPRSESAATGTRPSAGSGNPLNDNFSLFDLPQAGAFDLSLIESVFYYKSNQPKIGYQPNLNRNSDERPYSRLDFDTDRDACSVSAEPFSNSSGAAQYYSPNNPDKTGFNAFVPDAEGYPFAQIRYTPDKTNRPLAISKAGPDLKIGSGHETRIAYGTPAQDELDRMFGTDAGEASRYKKEMLTDENGQLHLTYKDIRGNVVATALSGGSPLAYAAVPKNDSINITLHLIEENNHLDETSLSLVSQKSILISQPTSLSFSYRLTPPTLSGIHCNGTSYCYDCMYDLSIIVRNSCGDSLWGRSQTIGSISPLSTCSAAPVAFDGMVPSVQPGNYFITKRLTVSAHAIDKYMADYRANNLCFRPVEAFYPTAGLGSGNNPCMAECNTCAQVPVTPARTFQVIQPDGSVRNMSIPQTRLAENDGTCMPVCPVKLPSPCETALTALLADVSPGGQYAEYRDTTYRDVAHPTGIVAPKIFPVSIMNDSANALPIRNANWRNPAFDYQNQDGTPAYIEIQSDGLPAHRAIDIMERDGKRFVKPQYLEYIEDFIRYWNPAFARSLVVYHPEYPYYLWCINNSSFNDFDTLLTLTSTYAKARDLNLLNPIAADPFFVSIPSALPLMSNELTNYMPLAGFSNLSIEEATYAAIHCNNANFSNAELNSCARGKVLYENAATADKEWNFYRDFYRVKRNNIRDNVRRSWILSNGYFDNRQIGTTLGAVAHPMFADKTKRFNENSDALAMLPTDIDTVSVETLMEWRKATIADAGEYCGGCAAGFDLSAWLNALVVEKKLTQSLSLPSVTPLAFSKPFTRYFEDSLSLSYQWNTTANFNNIVFTVNTARGAQCEINLNKTAAIAWDSIARFDCFKTAGASNNAFQIRAHTASDSVFDVTGSSSCMNFRSCGNAQVCDKTPAADDMAVLMKYLFQSSRYRNTNLTLRGRRGRTPYLGEGLRERAPNAHLWKWKMKTISEGEKQLTAVLEVYDNTAPPNPLFDNQRAYLCPFTLTVLSPGFGFNQVADIVDIDRPTTATQCSVVDFILTARTTGGALFKIAGTSCYPVYDCCHQVKGPTTALCCLPVMPKLEFEPNCLRDAEAVAENNRQRDAEDRLLMAADTFRTKLIRHCLSAAETFNAQYVDAVYQVTLMYYDRAGQLVKTIPPMGVRLLDATGIYRTRNARMDGTAYVPAHTMATTYRYNTFDQLVEKSSPDEGISRICYDENGRSILSQDATQRTTNTAIYTLYDKIGRIIESGSRPFTGAIPSHQRYSDFLAAIASAGGKTEIKRTRYDTMPSSGLVLFAAPPKKLRNRVAAIEAFETPATLTHASYFDYDALGNTRQVVQHFAMLPASTSGANVKRISYDYNSISGKVERVWYQKNHTDQLIHWYQYDADGRILLVQTGTNPNEPELLRETEARYYYYQHGPIARIELGTEKVQGIDYAYTINGMLKAINSGNCKPEFDMGGDGLAESGRHFVPDVFGQSLNFFNNDYSPISADAIQFYTQASGALETGFAKPLYNGFIRSMVSTIPAIDATPMARAFRYDQTGRLERMQTISDVGALTTNQVTGPFTDAFGMQLQYDANGNITRLIRKNQSGTDFDNLTYAYNSGNNQLNHILDAVAVLRANDLGNQTPDNYAYDGAGRLLKDGSMQMSWNSSGLIKEVRNAHGGNLQYGYDALNRRIVEKKNGIITDFYVNDVQGNRLASYTISGGTIMCRSLNLQGIGRLGEYQINREARIISADSGYFYRGQKRYEIINHIGDVQAVITDKRALLGEEARATVVSASDYFPFGMIMPGRKMGVASYTYGFQGMECDDDWADDGNEYTTAFRQYDPRVGRWMSVEPLSREFPMYSTYANNFNNPVNYFDNNGQCPFLWGAIIGGSVSIGMELYSSYTDPNYEFGWDAVARVAIGTGAGALTGGLSAIEAGAGLGVTVLAGAVIEATSNVLSQSVTMLAGHADPDINVTAVVLAGLSGGIGAGVGRGISAAVGSSRVGSEVVSDALSITTRENAELVTERIFRNSMLDASEAIFGAPLAITANLVSNDLSNGDPLEDAIGSIFRETNEDPGRILLREIAAETAREERRAERRRERSRRHCEREISIEEGDGFEIHGGGGYERPGYRFTELPDGTRREGFLMRVR